MEFQKLKIKRFAHKSFKHSYDAKYWKKFKAVFSQMEKGFMTADISFCSPQSNDVAGSSPGLMATATATRVDIWKLQQQAKSDDDEEPDQIEPWQSIRKFKEQITSIKLREDG